MPLIIQENPTFNADIVIADDVGFTVTFKAVPPWDLGKLIPEDASAEVRAVLINKEVVDLVVDWQGVVDESGKPVVFSQEHLMSLFKLPHGLVEKLIVAYSKSYGIEAEKN